MDFLGFSRPNRDLSMGYADKASKNFSQRFCRGVRGAGTEHALEAIRERRIVHGAA